jgi:hypothetical protein
MFVLDVKTGEKVSASIERIALSDLKKVKRENNFEFNWSEYKNQEVYKLVINDNEIMGLICVLDYPSSDLIFLKSCLSKLEWISWVQQKGMRGLRDA